jgi:hypothetical protein
MYKLLSYDFVFYFLLNLAFYIVISLYLKSNYSHKHVFIKKNEINEEGRGVLIEKIYFFRPSLIHIYN